MSIWKSISSFFSSLFQKKESITVETVSTNNKQQENTVVKEITEPIVIEKDTDKVNVADKKDFWILNHQEEASSGTIVYVSLLCKIIGSLWMSVV